MRTRKILIVALVLVIIVSFIFIPKLITTFRGEIIEILPNVKFSERELRAVKKTGEIKEVNVCPSENLFIYDGLEKNADYPHMPKEEILKGDLAKEKAQVSIHYDDKTSFDILAAKFDSETVVNRAFNWYRSGFYQIALDEDSPYDRIGDRSARASSLGGASILIAYKDYMFKIDCTYLPKPELAEEEIEKIDMEMAEALAKLILNKIDKID